MTAAVASDYLSNVCMGFPLIYYYSCYLLFSDRWANSWPTSHVLWNALQKGFPNDVTIIPAKLLISSRRVQSAVITNNLSRVASSKVVGIPPLNQNPALSQWSSGNPRDIESKYKKSSIILFISNRAIWVDDFCSCPMALWGIPFAGLMEDVQY